MICKYCNIETALSGGAHSNHVAWCHSNPKRNERAKGLEKSRLIRLEKPAANQFTKAKKEGRKIEVSLETREKLSKSSKTRIWSDEMKKNLSEIRKNWLSNNPDKHPWKRNDKFKSIPCEKLKEHLRKVDVNFVEEYTPLPDRAFAIDIAMPDIKLGIEVNGEQHYNRDGTLKKYYQERHDLIAKAGWDMIELHYSNCYNEDLVQLIKEKISERCKDLNKQDIT